MQLRSGVFSLSAQLLAYRSKYKSVTNCFYWNYKNNTKFPADFPKLVRMSQYPS